MLMTNQASFLHAVWFASNAKWSNSSVRSRTVWIDMALVDVMSKIWVWYVGGVVGLTHIWSSDTTSDPCAHKSAQNLRTAGKMQQSPHMKISDNAEWAEKKKHLPLPLYHGR
ncbi:hypothetical protein TNCV_3931421 [Trichonephila clavipes]|nr:hypothetical protein TNCV_3931421 [Trichonephila clavipes]